jgi:hypothetical protein
MLNKWVEVGNSGMFRPEMLEPMGFPKDVHVHGWGISLERPTMIRCVSASTILPQPHTPSSTPVIDTESTTSGR